MTAWSPLSGGLLTGKYAAGQTLDGRFASKEMQQLLPDQDHATRILASVDQVRKQTGRSKAQVALAWLRHREVPVIPIIGARKIGQLEDNLESLTLALDQDQIRLLARSVIFNSVFRTIFTARKWFEGSPTEGYATRSSPERARYRSPEKGRGQIRKAGQPIEGL